MLQFIKVEQLDPAMFAEIRDKALSLERSAYKHSKNVYSRTVPAIRDAQCAGGLASTAFEARHRGGDPIPAKH